MIFPLIYLVLVVTSHQRNGNQTGISRFDQLSVNCIEIILLHGYIIKLVNDFIFFLNFQLSVAEVKLSALEEERDILKSDIENCGAAKDELIKKAWDVRDAAVKRKNNTEIELARTRIDLMQVNSQLLEAIKQKVELSQQLDQWQVDMHELLEEQMVKKMRDQNKNSRARKTTAVSGMPGFLGGSGNGSDSGDNSGDVRKKSSKLLSFFQRS